MKKSVIFIGICLGLAHLIRAEPVPPEITDPEEREILGIAVTLTRPSLAYRVVASEKLLAEANFLAGQLKLPIQHPIRISDANVRVTAPWYSKRDSTNTYLSKADRIRAATFFASGSVESTNYTIYLGGANNSLDVQRLRIKNEDSIFELYPELAATPSLIDTNGSYQLATQWLSAVSVDVAALEQKHKLSIFQWFFWGKPGDLPKDHWTYNAPTTTNKTMLPLYDIKWGEGDTPAVKVTILGSSIELMELWIRDGSVYKRSHLIVTNAIELNTRPDPPVKRLERPIEELQTNSISHSNSPFQRPPPFRQQIKSKQ